MRAVSISVHKGLKIQGALCLERPPLRLVEPSFKRSWRAFREAWELRTGNQLTLEDELASWTPPYTIEIKIYTIYLYYI